MNFYKRHIGDYIKRTSHLSLLEHGVYTRLLDVYYTREGGIPDDQASRLISARSKPELDALKSVLSEFFTLVDGLWIKDRCEEEIVKANGKAESNRQNGKKGGRPSKKQNEVGLESKPKNNPDGFFLEPKNNLIQNPESRIQTPIPPDPPKPPEANGHHIAIPTDVERVFDHWRKTWGHATAKLDFKRTKAIRAALKDYTAEQLCTAITGYQNSPHHRGQNDRNTVYDALTLLLRDNEHIDAGLKFASKNPGGVQWQ